MKPSDVQRNAVINGEPPGHFVLFTEILPKSRVSSSFLLPVAKLSPEKLEWEEASPTPRLHLCECYAESAVHNTIFSKVGILLAVTLQ